VEWSSPNRFSRRIFILVTVIGQHHILIRTHTHKQIYMRRDKHSTLSAFNQTRTNTLAMRQQPYALKYERQAAMMPRRSNNCKWRSRNAIEMSQLIYDRRANWCDANVARRHSRRCGRSSARVIRSRLETWRIARANLLLTDNRREMRNTDARDVKSNPQSTQNLRPAFAWYVDRA